MNKSVQLYIRQNSVDFPRRSTISVTLNGYGLDTYVSYNLMSLKDIQDPSTVGVMCDDFDDLYEYVTHFILNGGYDYLFNK